MNLGILCKLGLHWFEPNLDIATIPYARKCKRCGKLDEQIN